jgi:hypothetical protein
MQTLEGPGFISFFRSFLRMSEYCFWMTKKVPARFGTLSGDFSRYVPCIKAIYVSFLREYTLVYICTVKQIFKLWIFA